MNRRTCTTVLRSGTTILEVLFAIFVVIVGLLGIASIIPLAARNASESNAHNNVQSLGPRWLHGFTTRGLNVTNSYEDKGQGYNWVWFRDYNNATGSIVFRKNYLGKPEATAVGVGAMLNQSTSGSLVTSGQIARIWGYQSVCIDPTFFTEPEVRQRLSAGGSHVLGYRATVFPYFEDGYNPLTDPFAPADHWHDQPRMIRTSLQGVGGIAARKLVDEIFSSPDDLAISTYVQDPGTGERVVDDTIPATRLFQSFTGGGVQKVAGSAEYSWLMTLSPEEPRTLPATPEQVNATTNNYTASLVVMHKRDRQFIAPGATPIPGSVEDKPAGERLVWVYPLSGDFKGGNGGRVRLIANAATEDSLHIGDWIMLGRHFMVNPGAPVQRYSYFRWYRIVAVDMDSRVDNLSNVIPSGGDPYGNAGSQVVWSRDVVLEGPDFSFEPVVNNNAVKTPTTGTLLDGVVTVLERQLTIE